MSSKFESDFVPFENGSTEDVKPVKVRPGTAKNYTNGIKYSENGRELWKIGAKQPSVPYATLGASEKKAWKHERKRQKREEKKALQRVRKDERKRKAFENARAKKAARAAAAAAKASTLPTDDGTGQPPLFFEDLNGEATARLQAKKEAKQAAKAEKAEQKRKRESTGTVIEAHNDLNDAANTAVPLPSAPPAKKKSKKAESITVVETESRSTSGKRKRDSAEPSDEGQNDAEDQPTVAPPSATASPAKKKARKSEATSTDGASKKSSRGKRKRGAEDGEEPKPVRKKNKDKYNKATRKATKFKHTLSG